MNYPADYPSQKDDLDLRKFLNDGGRGMTKIALSCNGEAISGDENPGRAGNYSLSRPGH